MKTTTARRSGTIAALFAGGVLAASALAADTEAPTPKPPANTPEAAKEKESPQNAADPAPGKPTDETKPAPKDANPPEGAPVQPAPRPTGKQKGSDNADRQDNNRPKDGESDRESNAAPSAGDRAGDDRKDSRDDRRNDRENRREDQGDRQDARDDRRSDVNRHQVNRATDSDAGRDGHRDIDRQARRSGRQNTNIGIDFRSGDNNQLLINSVGQKGYFGTVGFRPGDQIVSAGGQQFNNQTGFYTWLGTVAVGQRVPIVVLRNGQQETIYWTPTEEFIREYRESSAPGNNENLLGISLDDQVQDAAVVLDVQPNSPAHQAGIKPNDMIVAVNDHNISSPDDFYDAVHRTPAGKAVDMDVSRTMRLTIAENSTAAPVRQQQTNAPADQTPARVAQPPATPRTVPAQAAPNSPQPRRGVFRNR